MMSFTMTNDSLAQQMHVPGDTQGVYAPVEVIRAQ